MAETPGGSSRIGRGHVLLLAIIVLFAAVFRGALLDARFQYDAEGTGSSFGVMARNIMRFGWNGTHGMPVLNVAREPGAPLTFYPSHPPLVPLSIVPVYALAGEGEWQTRLPTALATIATIIAIYAVFARWSAPRVGVLAAAFYAAVPMTLYYGGMPEVVSVPLVLFAVLAVGAYVDLRRTPGARALGWLVLWFALAVSADWPAFFLVPVMLVHFAATKPRSQWRWMITFGGAAIVLFSAMYGYIAFATNSPWDWMAIRLRTRTGVGAGTAFTTEGWLATAWRFNLLRHTWPVLVLALGWVVTKSWRLRGADRATTLCRLLLAWGVIHVLVGREGVYVHEWWWTPLTAGLAVAAALAIEEILAWAERKEYAHAARIAVALAFVVFAGWTSQRVLREFAAARTPLAFTAVELGEAIRAAAPEARDTVALVYAGADPQLWFYGDRMLKLGVWSMDDLERRMHDGRADLMFYFEQPWTRAPVSLIFPLAYLDNGAFLAELQRHHPVVALAPHLAGKFRAFDLRSPSVIRAGGDGG